MAQFNTGTAHLVETTRFLVNDPSSAATNQYTDQEVKDAINVAYFDVINIIEARQPGYFVKVGYDNSVVDQKLYSLPSDFSRMIELVVEYNGLDIQSDNDAGPTRLSRVGISHLNRATRDSTSEKLWAPFHTQYAIYPPVDVAGTNSIRLTYEFEPSALSADDDSPLIPAQHHNVIPVKAAIWLLTSRNLDTRQLQIEDGKRTRHLLSTIMKRDIGDSDQFPSAAFDSSYDHASKQGQAA